MAAVVWLLRRNADQIMVPEVFKTEKEAFEWLEKSSCPTGTYTAVEVRHKDLSQADAEGLILAHMRRQVQ